MGDARDVARAEEEDEVAGTHFGAHGGDEVVEDGHEARGLAAGAHGVGEDAAVDAGDFRFARCVNLGEPEAVGVAETGGELREQAARAGEAMRLERDEQTPAAELFQRPQRRGDLARMMAVVIVDAMFAAAVEQFLPPRRAGETAEGAGDVGGFVAEFRQQRDDGGGVGDIFSPTRLSEKPPSRVVPRWISNNVSASWRPAAGCTVTASRRNCAAGLKP